MYLLIDECLSNISKGLINNAGYRLWCVYRYVYIGLDSYARANTFLKTTISNGVTREVFNSIIILLW